MKKYIAIGVALLLFAPLIFGSQIFPNIFPFTILQGGLFGGNDINTISTGANIGKSNTNTNREILLDPVATFDLEVGDGTVAKAPKQVSIGYIGTRIDPDTGKEVIFDQNLNRESPFSFQIGAGTVIPGFDQGVTGMRVGGKRLIIISPEMGYGNQQVGDIPPNTTLQFIVELYEVKE